MRGKSAVGATASVTRFWGNKALISDSRARSRCHQARTCGNSSGAPAARQASSGVPPESRRSSSSCSTRESSGTWVPLLVGAQISQFFRQQEQGAVEASLHRPDRDPQHLGGLTLQQSLDVDQAEHFPLLV